MCGTGESCPDGCEDADTLACAPIDMARGAEHPVARGQAQTIRVSCPNGDAIARWPRNVVAHRANDDAPMRLYLYDPSQPRARRVTPFGSGEYETYLRCVGRSNPRHGDAATWGEAENLTVPVCDIKDYPGERRAILGGGGARWTFRIYNMTRAQPGFRTLIKRTLMGFPIQHLQRVRLRTVFIDFVVGVIGRNGMGVDAEGDHVGVVSGGANWLVGLEHVDPEATAVLCVSYAALNRAWATGSLSNLPEDGEIDRAFGDPAARAITLYHEAGHLYHWTPLPADASPEDQQRRRAIARESAVGGLWDRYRRAIRYPAGARTQGPGEGFAEAYRKRLMGIAQPMVDATLDRAGMPSLASMQEVQRQISAG
jgi:hypothetical protein